MDYVERSERDARETMARDTDPFTGNITAAMRRDDPETYIGDAVYASFDGWQIKLRTGDGNNQTVYLEPEVYRALVNYAKRVGVRQP